MQKQRIAQYAQKVQLVLETQQTLTQTTEKLISSIATHYNHHASGPAQHDRLSANSSGAPLPSDVSPLLQQATALPSGNTNDIEAVAYPEDDGSFRSDHSNNLSENEEQDERSVSIGVVQKYCLPDGKLSIAAEDTSFTTCSVGITITATKSCCQ